MIIYSDTLHRSDISLNRDIVTELDLIAIFGVITLFREVSIGHLRQLRLASRWHLLLRIMPHMEVTCRRMLRPFFPKLVISADGFFFFWFLTSLGTSILLHDFCYYQGVLYDKIYLNIKKGTLLILLILWQDWTKVDSMYIPYDDVFRQHFDALLPQHLHAGYLQIHWRSCRIGVLCYVFCNRYVRVCVLSYICYIGCCSMSDDLSCSG